MNEFELLYQYVRMQTKRRGGDMPIRKILSDYVEYRTQLEDLRGKLRAAEASSARGESTELDVEELIAEVTEQLAAEYHLRHATSLACPSRIRYSFHGTMRTVDRG
jgi:hypothetical protein